MTAQVIRCSTIPEETVTLKLYERDGSLVDDVLATELDAPGRYAATFSNIAAGVYDLHAVAADGFKLASFWVDLLAEDGEYEAYEVPASAVGIDPSTLNQILDKVNLLNPAPTGSVLLVDSGDYYCTRQDVELVFGQRNVVTWADIDNEGDVDFIEDRVTTMIALAHELTNDALRQGGYELPFIAPKPLSLSYNVAALAGVLLYEARGATDSESDNGTHRLTPFRNRWDKYIKQLLSQQVKLDATRQNTTTAPQVY